MSLSKIVKDSILSWPVIDDDKSYNSIKSILEEKMTE